MQTVPLLFGLILGILLSLGSAWIYSMWRARVQSRVRGGEPEIEMRDDVLIGFLAVASFSLGVFLTYLLLSMQF